MLCFAEALVVQGKCHTEKPIVTGREEEIGMEIATVAGTGMF